MATKKNRIARKVYVYDDGTTGRSAKPNWQKLKFEFLAPKAEGEAEARVVNTLEVTADMIPEAMQHAAMGHGLSQKCGDAYADIVKKAKALGETEDKETGWAHLAKSLAQDVLDNIVNGVWVAEGEGSSGAGNVTILFEALVRAFQAEGVEPSEEQLAKIRQNLQDEKTREAVKARADVHRFVAEIQAERAAARAKAAAEAATTSGDEEAQSLADLLA